MDWKQIIDPFGNIALSALVAVIPVLFIFWALIVKKMKGYKASIGATVIAILIAIFIYGMPVKLALLSTANGASVWVISYLLDYHHCRFPVQYHSKKWTI